MYIMTAHMQLVMIPIHVHLSSYSPSSNNIEVSFNGQEYFTINQVQKHTYQMTSSAALLSTCTFAFTDLTLGRMVTSPKK